MTKRFPIHWPTAIFLVLFHLGAIVAPFFLIYRLTQVSLSMGFLLTGGMFALTILVWQGCGLGITMGYHRLLTHRGFKTSLLFEYFLVTIGNILLQGGPISWVAKHREHHAHSDVPGEDVHTPKDGTWWAHFIWIIRPDPSFKDREFHRKRARDMCAHWYYRRLEHFFWVPIVLWAGVCYYFGGLLFVCFGVALPAVLSLQSTWMVNSVTHMKKWGSRRFETPDDSRNNGLVAALTLGEGWHNNHHKYQWSARHGLGPQEFDLTWEAIKFCRMLHLIREVRAASL